MLSHIRAPRRRMELGSAEYYQSHVTLGPPIGCFSSTHLHTTKRFRACDIAPLIFSSADVFLFRLTSLLGSSLQYWHPLLSLGCKVFLGKRSALGIYCNYFGSFKNLEFDHGMCIYNAYIHYIHLITAYQIINIHMFPTK